MGNVKSQMGDNSKNSEITDCVQLKGHTQHVNVMFFDSTSGLLYTGSDDKEIREWDIIEKKCLRKFSGHQGKITCIYIKNGRMFSASSDGTLKMLNLKTGAWTEFAGHTSYITNMTVDLEGNRLFSGSNDSTLRSWDLDVSRAYSDDLLCLTVYKGHTDCVTCLKLLHCDGYYHMLYSGSADNTIKFWNINNGTCEKTLEGHKGWVWSIEIDKDSKILYSASADCTIRAWNLDSGEVLRVLEGHNYPVFKLQLDDNRHLYSLSFDFSIRQWNKEGQCTQIFEGHENKVKCFELIKDNNVFGADVLVTGSEDATVRIWNVRNGKCIYTLKGHTGKVNAVLLADKRLISCSDDTTLCVWSRSKLRKALSGSFQSVRGTYVQQK